ncbi:MAG: hypothetical protein LBG28_10100 [Tannerella sp.]|jgi:hypothetical protein|nr:hypothetical protein [Tannerella sp.]
MNNHVISIIKKRIGFTTIIPLLFLLCTAISCDDINSIHQKYYDQGEDIYTGVIDSLKTYAGYERIRFEWEVNSDPRITKVIIYWNQRADSVIVDANRTQSGSIPMNYYLENISEGSYIFEFITRDNEGHHSLAKEATVTVYGEAYTQTLRNRNVSSIVKQLNGDMLITWDAISSRDIQYTTIEYTLNGETESIRVENSDTETKLTKLQSGDEISVYTTYLPENALDLLKAPRRTFTMPKLDREVNKANFAIVVLAGDNTSVNGDRNLARIWDGAIANPNILHTVENAAGFNFPHHFTFDMGVLADIGRFRIWPRTDAGAFTGHSPRYFEIWGAGELKKDADDESYWKTDAWKADWKLMGDHTIVKPSTEDAQKTEWAAGWEYSVNENVGRVRYIRLIMKTGNWQNSNCVNIGEITLWGDDL